LKSSKCVESLVLYGLTKSVGNNSGVNFINIKCAHFLYERLFSSYVLALNKLSYKKIARLTLMKLTAGFERGEKVPILFFQSQINQAWDFILLLFPMTCSLCLVNSILTSALTKTVSKNDTGTLLGLNMAVHSVVRLSFKIFFN